MSNRLVDIRSRLVFLADAVDRVLVGYEQGNDIPYSAAGLYLLFQDVISQLDEHVYDKDDCSDGGPVNRYTSQCVRPLRK